MNPLPWPAREVKEKQESEPMQKRNTVATAVMQALNKANDAIDRGLHRIERFCYRLPCRLRPLWEVRRPMDRVTASSGDVKGE